MTSATCPICKKPIKPRSENPAFPFCGPRCKQVDLGKWLSEEYRVPGEPAEAVDDGADDGPPEGRGPSNLH